MEPSKRDYAKEVYAELAAWKKKRRRISHHPSYCQKLWIWRDRATKAIDGIKGESVSSG